jgi:hypothetical protein
VELPPAKDSDLDLVVVVPSFNQRVRLAECLDAAIRELAQSGLRGRVVVVDNASWDGSGAMVEARFPDVTLIENEVNQGFSVACNQGGRLYLARHVLLLNNDAVLEPGALRAMVEMAEARPTVGAVTGRLLAPTGRERYPAAHVWQRWLPPPRRAHMLAWVPGTAVLLRREALDAVGWLDEAFFFYNEDLDLSWRLRRAGWELWYCPAAVVFHHEGGSSQHIRDRVVLEGYRGSLLLARKHHGRVGYALTRAALRLAVKARLAGLRVLQRFKPHDGALTGRIVGLEAVREVLRAGIPPAEPMGVPATPEG